MKAMHPVSSRRLRAIRVTTIVVLLAFTYWVAKEAVGSDTKVHGRIGGGKRRLLTKKDKCSLGGLSDPLNFTHPATGILYFIGMMWTFACMGQVCEDYFVSALNAMVKTWKISPDIAGAIFMAAGTSMPEVFAALVGLFSSIKSDTGINTVVGSTVFNIIFIIGGSIIAYPGPDVIMLPIISLLRDSLFFTIAVLLLYFSFRDTFVTLTDCLPLLATYCCYVISCSATPMIEEYTVRFIGKRSKERFVQSSIPEEQEVEEQQKLLLLSPTTSTHRTYNAASPHIYPLKSRKSLNALKSFGSIYGSVPRDTNVSKVYHNNYELMLRSRANVVSALFGLPDGHGAEDGEISTVEPLTDTANTVGKGQLQAVEQLFFDGSFILHQNFGGDLHLAGNTHPVNKSVLVADIMNHSPGMSSTDSQWSDLVEALNAYDLNAITKVDFIPIYKTWYQCSRVLRLPMKINHEDVESVYKIFGAVIAPSKNLMSKEEVVNVVNQLSLSFDQKAELLRLLESTKPEGWGDHLTRSGCETLFLQWIAYARSLLDKHVNLPCPRLRSKYMCFDERVDLSTEYGEITEDDEIPVHTVFKMPKHWFERVCFVIGLPMSICLYLSVPDCRIPKKSHLFLPSMLISMLWLVILVYLMLNWAQKWGCLWGVSPSLMGITVTAAGTSVPDFLASIAVARAGEGQMSVTNAFGSNIFGIGLALPFAVKSIVTGEPVKMPSQGLLDSVCFMIGLQVAFLLIVSLYKLRLPTVFGYVLVASYVGFVVYQVVSLE